MHSLFLSKPHADIPKTCTSGAPNPCLGEKLEDEARAADSSKRARLGAEQQLTGSTGAARGDWDMGTAAGHAGEALGKKPAQSKGEDNLAARASPGDMQTKAGSCRPCQLKGQLGRLSWSRPQSAST